MKRIISLFTALTLMLILFSACAATKDNSGVPEKSPAATVAFTDSVGRTVEVPAEITKIAVSGSMAQIVLFALAPDRLVGIASKWDASAEKYFNAEYYALPIIGTLYGTKGDLNLEELQNAAPDVVIDVGTPKEGIASDLDALQEQTGIPFIHISANTETTPDAFRSLGKLLSMEAEAEELAVYCENALDTARRLMERVGEENKKTLLYCVGDKGLNVVARGAYHAEVLDMMSDNLAVTDSPSSSGTGNETDMEQLLLWNPSVIIFAPDSAYNLVGSDETWLQLQAISGGTYYEAPAEPYNWLGFPASVQRYLGMLWLGTLLYPEQADYDLYEQAAEFYELFYHCDLSREQFDALSRI